MLDVLIIGGGPAGLSSAVYAKRAGLSVTVLDKGASECQITKATEVENYLGFKSISGIDLHAQFVEHAKSQEIPIIKKSVVSVEKTEEGFKVFTKKDEFECKHLILAMGRSHKHLGVEGEDRLAGAGVSYCATCDGFFFRSKMVSVIGGGDSAVSQAIYLSAFCEKVYLIHRRDEFRAANYLVERAREKNNIEFVLNATVNEILGDNCVAGVSITQGEETRTIACDGVFGAVGEKPNMSFVIDGLNISPQGQIITDKYCRTNINGLYAVGDIRDRDVYQIITAVADGALVVEGILKE
ncbi:MAG: FAD-dependent oxidoreductase [Clostridia bacterium]|nr:FAD-dependent oxidoreductase [Clostridia bacterium]